MTKLALEAPLNIHQPTKLITQYFMGWMFFLPPNHLGQSTEGTCGK